MFVRSNEDKLEIWECVTTEKMDNVDIPIQWMVITRQMDFQAHWTLKKLTGGELFVKDLDGTVTFDIDYRPDDYVCAVNWSDFSECATTEICDDDECVVPVNRHPKYRTRLMLGEPTDECNSVANRNMRFGYKFQPIIKVTGAAKLCGMRLKAETMIDPKDVACGAAECKVHECCPINPMEYSSEEEPV
jgi:hypothetical protein